MSARSCTQVRADLSAYLDGDFDAGLTDAIRAHLDGCEACRSELDLLRLTVSALRRLPDLPPPAAILSGVRARLRPEPWYRRLLDDRPLFLGVPIGALATLLAVVGISLFQARYPDMSKTVTQGPFPQSRAPEMQAKTSPIAKGALGSATLPQGSSGGREVNAPESSAVAIEIPQPAQPELPVAAPKDALREESQREENVAAAPSRSVIPSPEPAMERTRERYPAGQPARVQTSTNRGIESRAVFDRKADSGSGLGYTRLAGEKKKATATTWIGIVCLLRPDGDTVNDLERLLRREGAVDIAISVLEPRAIREAFAPYRGRLGFLPEPSRGWTVTASVRRSEFPRLLDALTSRTSLRILDLPAAPPAMENPTEPLGLRLTVLR